jgi:hypothetical protein
VVGEVRIFDPLSFYEWTTLASSSYCCVHSACFYTPFCSPMGASTRKKGAKTYILAPAVYVALFQPCHRLSKTGQLLVFCLTRQLRAVSGIVTPREALPVTLTGAEVSDWLRQRQNQSLTPAMFQFVTLTTLPGAPRPPACDQRPGFPIRGKSFTGMLALDLLAAGLERWELLERNRSPDVCPFSNQSSDSSLLFL